MMGKNITTIQGLRLVLSTLNQAVMELIEGFPKHCALSSVFSIENGQDCKNLQEVLMLFTSNLQATSWQVPPEVAEIRKRQDDSPAKPAPDAVTTVGLAAEKSLFLLL